MLSPELSFQLNLSNVQEGPLPCCVQKKFAITLPSIALESKKSFTVTLINLRAQNFANNYLSQNISLKQDVYSGTFNGIDRDKTRFQLSAVRCQAGMSSMMCYGARLLDYDNEYRRLKLGKNVLNFFHVSHKINKERVDTPEADEFEVLMNVGSALLTEGEQGLDGRLEVGVASRMLKEAATRFAAASAISPSSVAAVNALGTTLLVHGKLKLTLSEKLRDMLLETRAPRQKWDSKETATSLEDRIPKVCEECEKLLIEAGRNFGKAVSLDKSNDFALHSWGIALFHRARLIATDGLEDALKDADKMYLTAIDKFKATSQLGKDYSGAAYFCWSLALRDRYWLHGLASKADIQLLQQAKWASEQALKAYPHGLEAKLVVRICMEELVQFQTQQC